jgi:hypothetical protein
MPEPLGWEEKYFSFFQLTARLGAESTANNADH